MSLSALIEKRGIKENYNNIPCLEWSQTSAFYPQQVDWCLITTLKHLLPVNKEKRQQFFLFFIKAKFGKKILYKDVIIWNCINNLHKSLPQNRLKVSDNFPGLSYIVFVSTIWIELLLHPIRSKTKRYNPLFLEFNYSAFSRAWNLLHVSAHLKHVACFPVLGACSTFSRT